MENERLEPVVLTRKETAQILGISVCTLAGLDIPRTKVNKRNFYKKSEVLKWLDKQTEKKRGGDQ